MKKAMEVSPFSDKTAPAAAYDSLLSKQTSHQHLFSILSFALFLIPLLCYVLLSEQQAFFAVFFGTAIFLGLPLIGLGCRWCRKQTLLRIVLCTFVLLGIGYLRALQVRLSGTTYAKTVAAAAAAKEHTFIGTIDRAEVVSVQNVYVRLTHMDGKPLQKPLLTYAENSTGHFLPQYETVCFSARLCLPQQSDSGEKAFARSAEINAKGVYALLYDVKHMQLTGQKSLDRFGRREFCEILFSGAHQALATQKNKQEYSQTQALLDGVLYGDKGDFSKDEKEIFALSGLTHILCVSGLHFSMVFALVGALLGRLVRHRRLRLVLLYAISVLYLYICGFTPSALRAACMAYVTLFGRARQSVRRSTENLLLAVAAICFLRPEVVFDTGFHLSVLSSLGILLSMPLLRITENRIQNRFASTVFSAVTISVSAYAFTFCYSQSVFGSVGLGNIFASCLAIVPTQLLLTLAWISVILVPVMPASAGLFGTIFTQLTTFILWLASFFSSFPRIESLFLGSLSASAVFFGFYFLAFLAARHRARSLKIWAAVVCGVMLAATAEMLYGFVR